jgi:hypothetical protein
VLVDELLAPPQVTFRDPDSASKACEDPTPVIDGRRANCNLASLGRAQHPVALGIFSALVSLYSLL